MIIAIDGLDGSGKETACNNLKEIILKERPDIKEVVIHSFPDYNIPSGKDISLILSGDVMRGIQSQSKSIMISELFAYNRYEHFLYNGLHDINAFDDPEVVHIFDRYWASNIIYQGLGKVDKAFSSFIETCRSMDIAFNNPLPDKYFFLRVPFSVLIQRLTERNLSKSGVVDTYEEPTFQMAVYLQSEYMLLLLNRNHMLYNDIIEGTYYTEKGTIKAYKPKEIAFNIYKASFDIK